jgi:hypothetical protein
VQTIDVNVSDEEGSKGRKEDLQALLMSEIPTPPPLVDSGKPGYI